MPEYRVFRLGRSGAIISAHPMVCDDDAQACAIARDIWPASKRELWNLDRQVAVLDVEAKEPASESGD